MTIIIVNIIGFLLILFIIYWFWLAKTQSVIAQQKISIIVADGAYTPSVIKTKAGEELTLEFVREDASPCAEYVVFNDFDISAQLPLKQPHQIKIKPTTPGKYEFTCQMGMYRGQLVVET